MAYEFSIVQNVASDRCPMSPVLWSFDKPHIIRPLRMYDHFFFLYLFGVGKLNAVLFQCSFISEKKNTMQ